MWKNSIIDDFGNELDSMCATFVAWDQWYWQVTEAVDSLKQDCWYL